MSVAVAPSSRSTSASLPVPVLVSIFLLIWTSAFSVAKVAIADCPPLLLLAFRFLAAGILMLAFRAVTRSAWTLRGRDVMLFALLGIANQAIYLGVGYVGLQYVSSGLSVLIFSANPVITAVLAALLLNERITWAKIAGLVLGVGGVTYIVESRLSAGTDHLIGIVLSVAATLSFVGGTIAFKRFAPKDGLWAGNAVQALAAGIVLLPFSLTFESIGDVVPSWRLAAAFVYLVLIVSVVAYLLWFKILAVSGATAASSYYFLMPPLGMLFGWLLLGERLAAADLLGIVPVALAIWLVTRPAPLSVIPREGGVSSP